jgi:hypothetical protein
MILREHHDVKRKQSLAAGVIHLYARQAARVCPTVALRYA